MTAERRPDIWKSPKNSPIWPFGERYVRSTRSEICGAAQKNPMVTATAQNAHRVSARTAAMARAVHPERAIMRTRFGPYRETRNPVAHDAKIAMTTTPMIMDCASVSSKPPTLMR